MSYSACQINSSIELGCVGSAGGVKTIFLLNGAITGTSTTANGAISGITGTGDLYEFQVQKQTSSLTETFNISLENGTTYYEQITNAIFNKIDAAKRDQLRLLSRNRQIVLFVEDNNSQVYYLGNDFSGGFVSAGTSETGTAFGDRNGYNISISTFSQDPMLLLDGSLATVVSGITINS